MQGDKPEVYHTPIIEYIFHNRSSVCAVMVKQWQDSSFSDCRGNKCIHMWIVFCYLCLNVSFKGNYHFIECFIFLLSVNTHCSHLIHFLLVKTFLCKCASLPKSSYKAFDCKSEGCESEPHYSPTLWSDGYSIITSAQCAPKWSKTWYQLHWG